MKTLDLMVTREPASQLIGRVFRNRNSSGGLLGGARSKMARAGGGSKPPANYRATFLKMVSKSFCLHGNVLLPHMQGVADVEELLLPVQLELVQRFRPGLPPEAINFLTVHTNDVAQVAVPPENRAEHVVKFAERHLIGDRDQADDPRAHLGQNRSQNQAFEGGGFNHLSRLLGSPDPRLFGALDLRTGLPALELS